MSSNKVYYLLPIAMLTLVLAIYFTDFAKKEVVPTYPDSKVITLYGGQFDHDVNVIITPDTAMALQYVRENLDSSATTDDFDSRATTFGTIDGKPTIIWLPTVDDLSIVNHELFHASIDVMKWARIPLTDDTEEVYAYELQYLTVQFLEQIKE